jgi:hypothetical protein
MRDRRGALRGALRGTLYWDPSYILYFRDMLSLATGPKWVSGFYICNMYICDANRPTELVLHATLRRKSGE